MHEKELVLKRVLGELKLLYYIIDMIIIERK